MFCSRCGTANVNDARFCFNCGSALSRIATPVLPSTAPTAPEFAVAATHEITATTGSVLGASTTQRAVVDTSASVTAPTPFFSVATHKFVLLSLCTFGIYEIYWFYENWRRLQKPDEQISPLWRSLFAPFWAFQLFERVRDRAAEYGAPSEWSPRGLASVYLILNLLWRLPDPWWLICFLTVVPMIPVQQTAQRVNRQLGESDNASYTTANVVTLVVGGTLLVLAIVGTLTGSNK
jgi:hypothetical protein